ncbi:hypothetical protein [Arenivirga flava]|uniref:Uncharacterized protein n=1 Tax=Arenivirga flava TaxID=1930060 RepID=A0AA37XBR2_9MICO|nr:hypothetical protein [Arenivirga flava]GMA28903.1 hypothetical protein GCM10025874_21560 [Arenivirga flava]
MSRSRRASVIALVVTGVLVIAIGLLGSLETLVWAPLAMTDDAYDLADIEGIVGAEVFAAARIVMIVWALAGIAAVVGMAWVVRQGASLPVVLLIGAALVWLGPFSLVWAGFGLGNTISDEVPPYVGSWSPVGFALHWFGVAAFVAVLGFGVLALVRAVRSR